jgi:hypothetical protein
VIFQPLNPATDDQSRIRPASVLFAWVRTSIYGTRDRFYWCHGSLSKRRAIRWDDRATVLQTVRIGGGRGRRKVVRIQDVPLTRQGWRLLETMPWLGCHRDADQAEARQ